MKKTIWICAIFVFSFGAGAKAQSVLDERIAEKIEALTCAEPTEGEPVTLNAAVVAEGDSLAVIVKARMAPGWHIYQYVPPNMPYIATEPVLKLPENVQASGEWAMAQPIPSPTDRGVLIYEKEAWFVQKVKRGKDANGVIQAGLYYQTCDLRQCLPPVEKTFELNIDQATE